MYKKSPRVPPRFHSKMDAFLPVISCFLCLVIAVMVAGLVVKWDSTDFGKGMFIIFILFPILLLFGIWGAYYKIRIEDGQVQLRDIFRQATFLLDDISGYALSYTSAKGQQVESLNIGLKDGRFFTLHAQYYSNYFEIKLALTDGKSPDPVVMGKAAKWWWQRKLIK